MALATAIGVGLALLILAIVAVTAGTRPSPKSAARSNGGPVSIFVASLAYIVVMAPVITRFGLNAGSMVLLMVLSAFPAVIAGLIVPFRRRLAGKSRDLYDIAGVVTAFALLVGLLATIGEFVSLFGMVSRGLTIAVVGVAIAAYVYLRGRQSSNRTSRWVLAMAFLLPVVLFLIGILVSSPTVVISSLVPSTPIPPSTIVGLAVVMVALGFVDPAMSTVLRGSSKPGRAATCGAIIAVGFVLIFSLGLILVYGGAFVAPSLQAFLLAATPPMFIGFFVFLATYVLASTADTQASAGGEVLADLLGPARRPVALVVLVLIAIVVAVLLPGPGQILIVASLIAAPVIGSVMPTLTGKAPTFNPVPAFAVGVVAEVVIALVVGLQSTFDFRGATLVVVCVGFLLSGALALVTSRKLATHPSVESK